MKPSLSNRFILDLSDYLLKDFKFLWISFRIENKSQLKSYSKLDLQILDKNSFSSRYISSLNMLNSEQKISFPLTFDDYPFEYVYQIELR